MLLRKQGKISKFKKMTCKSQQGPKCRHREFNFIRNLLIHLVTNQHLLKIVIQFACSTCERNEVINKHNSTISKFSKNNKHSQCKCKLSYNTLQATHLLQHNNPPQHNYHNHKYRMLTSIGKKVVINKHNSIS